MDYDGDRYDDDCTSSKTGKSSKSKSGKGSKNSMDGYNSLMDQQDRYKIAREVNEAGGRIRDGNFTWGWFMVLFPLLI